jgi:hypothetical protein
MIMESISQDSIDRRSLLNAELPFKNILSKMWRPMSNSIRSLIIGDEPSVANVRRMILEAKEYGALATVTALKGVEERHTRRWILLAPR